LFAAGPNIVLVAAADETPAERPKAILELAALHKANIHVYV
jgi:hypothetical protein